MSKDFETEYNGIKVTIKHDPVLDNHPKPERLEDVLEPVGWTFVKLSEPYCEKKYLRCHTQCQHCEFCDHFPAYALMHKGRPTDDFLNKKRQG